MDIYTLNLTGLLALCGALFVAQRTPNTKSPKPTKNTNKANSQWSFLVVYALVMGADWLQGPFLYSLYHDEHNISSSLISALFTTGFVSGGVSGTFIGSLADRHGRKFACLVFCLAYSLSCLLTISPSAAALPSIPLLLLFLGRVLGGLSTSLLFTVFESWMVTDARARGLSDGDLSSTFGLMSTLNSVVAILSGVGSEWLVSTTGTKKAPFVGSTVLLVIAFGIIYTQWTENYGQSGGTSPAKKTTTGVTNKLWTTLSNPKVLSLGLASTMFEGSMYLFVFFWVPALKAVVSADTETDKGLPYGVIFAAFMAATLASSLAFTTITRKQVLGYASLLLAILGTSAACFFLLVRPKTEQTTFWLFCLFEAAVGMYFPCMGYLKGRLIDDGVRAQVYGFLRIPLNVFVVVSLLFTGDGDAGTVFLVCGTLLLASCGALWVANVQEAS
ncbi:major facilitator superfamily transporter [Diplogelasinospora grovesii]|uniref:Molybdate-anion transporter n=1 Tax=Diplogelasinospora grovesii TaxID=303347 RepID=A0AAN6S2B6_9PEZI|nr:major facilitator superfamily transporter [Diplogelasinospora grovesii]